MNSNAQKRRDRLKEARKKGTHTESEWLEMKHFFEYTCVRCDGQSGLINVERDHIIPVYQGGSDSISNIQPVCARCNASKGSEVVDHRIAAANRLSKSLPIKYTINGQAIN